MLYNYNIGVNPVERLRYCNQANREACVTIAHVKTDMSYKLTINFSSGTKENLVCLRYNFLQCGLCFKSNLVSFCSFEKKIGLIKKRNH